MVGGDSKDGADLGLRIKAVALEQRKAKARAVRAKVWDLLLSYRTVK